MTKAKYTGKQYQEGMPEQCKYKSEAIASCDYCWGNAVLMDEGKTMQERLKNCKNCGEWGGDK